MTASFTGVMREYLYDDAWKGCKKICAIFVHLPVLTHSSVRHMLLLISEKRKKYVLVILCFVFGWVLYLLYDAHNITFVNNFLLLLESTISAVLKGLIKINNFSMLCLCFIFFIRYNENNYRQSIYSFDKATLILFFGLQNIFLKNFWLLCHCEWCDKYFKEI